MTESSNTRVVPLRIGAAALMTALLILPGAPVAASVGAPTQPRVSSHGPGTLSALGEDSVVIVGFSADAERADIHRRARVGDVVNSLHQIDVDVVAVPPGTVDEAIAVYERLPGVDFADRNVYDQLLDQTSEDSPRVPNDPLLSEQYLLDRINAVEGWEAYHEAMAAQPFQPNGGATIAVLDSGIDLSHPEFAGKVDLVTGCRNFITGTGTSVPGCQESTYHGTAVAGVAAAVADNAQGVAGVGFDANLMSLWICHEGARCGRLEIAAAIVYAVENGADVINMSFGGAAPETGVRKRALEFAAEQGVLMVAAAGNSGQPNTVLYPAASEEVIAVSGTNPSNRLGSFSSYGPEVEVAAPGEQITTTLPGAGLVYSQASTVRFNGTSFSAPAVAGLGALLMNMGLDARQAREVITAGANVRIVGETERTPKYGHGMIDVEASVDIAACVLKGEGDVEECAEDRASALEDDGAGH